MPEPVDQDNDALATVETTPVEVVSAEPPPKRRPGGCIWILGGLTGCLLCPLILLAMPVLFGFTTANNLLSGIERGIESIIHPGPAVATTTSSATIVESVMPLGQIVSVREKSAVADIHVGIAQGTCSYGADHVAAGTIDAGIDLTKFTPSDVQYDAATNKYVITLPAPELTSCSIDYIRQYTRSTTLCNVDWDEARVLAGTVALQQLRDDAIEGGILTRAEREATIALGTFIQDLTGARVEIHFAPALSSPVYPATCHPTTPEGWTYRADTGAWTKGS